MLTTYSELLKNYNPNVPTALQLPQEHMADTVKIADETFEMTIKLNGDIVTEIDLVVNDDAVEGGSFYAAWVGGFESGMGWESNNYYNAMMATLQDHGSHTGINRLGIVVVHSWFNGRVHINVTKK